MPVCHLAVVVWVSPCHADHVADPLAGIGHLRAECRGLWRQSADRSRLRNACWGVGSDGRPVSSYPSPTVTAVVATAAALLGTVRVQARHPLNGPTQTATAAQKWGVGGEGSGRRDPGPFEGGCAATG